MMRGQSPKRRFNVGDHVEWNSEAGRVRGTITKRLTADVDVNGYVHHASPEAPQYLIQSDKTSHIAIHKGSALRMVKTRAPTKRRVPRQSNQ